MKFLQQLMEMAKSKNKRKREAKRTRKDKAKNPTLDDKINPVAKFAQTSGAGAHENAGGKLSSKKRQRKEGKDQIKQQMDD